MILTITQIDKGLDVPGILQDLTRKAVAMKALGKNSVLDLKLMSIPHHYLLGDRRLYPKY
jgi:hypothetical protein